MTERGSFNNVKQWLSEIERYASKTVTKLLVGNKCDLNDKRVIEEKEAKEFAGIEGIDFVETSAKADIGVDVAFQAITRKIKDNVASQKPASQPTESVDVSKPSATKKEKNCKC